MMLEKRPALGKAKSAESGTKVRLADGRTVIFPISNPHPIAFARALMRRRKRLAAPRTAESIRERMRRGLAARERELSPVEQTCPPLPGGWVLDLQ